MRILSPYTHPHNWLKGNFHTHTTSSDGQGAPEDVIAMYRDDNYDFLSLTDHRKHWTPSSPSAGQMLLIPGEECHLTDSAGATDTHVVSLGAATHVDDSPNLQTIIDAVNSAGGLAIIAHPNWTYMPFDQLAAVHGYAAFEVWNGGCSDVSRADSTPWWDWYLTRHGRPLWGVGTDDMHKTQYDFATGWTWVNSPRQPRAVLDALRRGDSYASSGPRIENIIADGSSITLYTSSARFIKFMSKDGGVLKWVEGKNVKRASFSPKGDELYVRAEVHAADGTRAWTNPFFIEQ